MIGRRYLSKIAAKRFNRIKHTFDRRQGEYLYNGLRCSTKGVSNRFATEQFRVRGECRPYNCEWFGLRGKMKYLLSCITTFIGLHDYDIEQTYHERAQSEWWYRYEKEWD